MTENLVHTLAKFIPKSQARLIVEDAVQEARANSQSIFEVLTNKVEVLEIISKSILEDALKPQNSTGDSKEMVNKIKNRLDKHNCCFKFMLIKFNDRI